MSADAAVLTAVLQASAGAVVLQDADLAPGFYIGSSVVID